jgi:ATPase subunit of ABC transporter with duplicated ATPase domains
VSVSLSIFEKLCPSCASRISASAETCDCGHVFESANGSGKSSQETALRDEELYENYLAARADQANEAARAAHEAYHTQPDDADRAAAAELAREVAASIASDLAQQRAKVAALRKALPPAPKPVAAAPKPSLP